MTPAEIQATTIQLNELLVSRGLRWVVEQVSNVIEEGIEEKRSVAFEQFSIYGEATPKRGPKSDVTATRPYTDDEQLELLVSAIKCVLVDGSAMRHDIFSGLGKYAEVRAIRFEPDVPPDIQEKGFVRLPEKQGKPFTLTPRDASDVEKLHRLLEFVTKIKGELHAHK